jgi:hypothetical protein
MPLALSVVMTLALMTGDATPTRSFTGEKFPPPGLPEDQALIGSMLTTQASIVSDRLWAIRTMNRLHGEGVMDRLAQLAATAPPNAAARTGDLREHLKRAWDADRDLISRPWPFDPRLGCRSQGIALETVMADAHYQDNVERVKALREAARKCLERQTSVLKPLQAANSELMAVAAEARAALATAPVVRGAATSSAPAAAPGRASGETP